MMCFDLEENFSVTFSISSHDYIRIISIGKSQYNSKFYDYQNRVDG